MSVEPPGLRPVILTATIRQKPSPGSRDVGGLETRHIHAEGAEYDTAMAGLVEQTSSDWQLLYAGEHTD